MPRNRPRTTNKAKWTKDDLEKAVRAARDGVSIRKASKIFMIPFSTLQERIKKNLPITAPSLGRHATFSPEEEKGMAENIKLLAKLYYGLSPLQVRRAAYVYAEKHNIKHTFNKERQMAGKDWLYGFLKRNSSITIRQPEEPSINRVTAFNKEEVSLFFKNLEDIMETYQFAASKIYNMDETGISTVQDPGTVIAEKGQKRVGSVTSYERGKNITVICAVSASRSYIPPMFIYPRKRMSPQLSKDGPNEAIYHCSKNGWTNQDLFVIWLKHFVHFARPSSAEPVLLVLDNHYSHVSLEAYTFCRENFIVVLSIPPHTSHRMQPLDVAFYGPLKAAFRRQCDLFMKSHALLKITPYDVASIFNKAYCDTATIQKGVSGFKASGIMPIDPTVFGEEDFLASDYLLGSQNDTVTVMNDSTANPMDHDQATSTFPLEANNFPEPSAQVQIAPEANNLSETSNQLLDTPEDNNLPETSAQIQVTTEANNLPQSNAKLLNTPEDNNLPRTSAQIQTVLSPLPLLPTQARKRANTKQHSAILTATPLKAELENKERKRQEKLSKDSKKIDKKTEKKVNKKTDKKTDNKKINTTTKRRQLKTSKKSRIDPEFCSSDEEVLASKKKKKNLKSTRSIPDSSDEENLESIDDSEQEICCICKEFGKNEIWFRCRGCGKWAHKECSGADSPEKYECDSCVRINKVTKRLDL